MTHFYTGGEKEIYKCQEPIKKERKDAWNLPEGEWIPLSQSICCCSDVPWHPTWLRHLPAGGSNTFSLPCPSGALPPAAAVKLDRRKVLKKSIKQQKNRLFQLGSFQQQWRFYHTWSRENVTSMFLSTIRFNGRCIRLSLSSGRHYSKEIPDCWKTRGENLTGIRKAVLSPSPCSSEKN